MSTSSKQDYSTRLTRLRQKLPPDQVLLVSKPSDITYLTGFTDFLLPFQREALAIVSQIHAVLLHPHFLAVSTPPGWTSVTGTDTDTFQTQLTHVLKHVPNSDLLLDAQTTFVHELDVCQHSTKRIKKISPSFCTEFRLVKSQTEMAHISHACQITQKVVSKALTKLKVGLTEIELATWIDWQFKAQGAQGNAFPTIVAFGANSALPHHQPSNAKLKLNQVVLIDCGAKYNSYCSDMTRTEWFGPKPSKEFTQVKQAVMDAYQAGSELLQTKLDHPQTLPTAAQLDAACRNSLKTAKLDKHFIHTSGHGLGLDIHEAPSLSSSNTTQLQPGMVITLEPGVYLPGQFGVRYENTVIL